MKNLILLSIFLSLTVACGTPDKKQTEKMDQDSLPEITPPLILDDIHYYTLDRKEMTRFFVDNFGARIMAEKGVPLEFIDFVQLAPGQSTLNISGQGPFEGIAVGDPSRWKRKLMEPSPDLPPMYGIYYVGLACANLEASLENLFAKGVAEAEVSIFLPQDPEAKFATLWAPDFNLLVLREDPNYGHDTPFALDHLLILVKNLKTNLSFYQEAFGAQLQDEGEDWAYVQMGQHDFLIAEPQALGFDPEEVQKRKGGEFRPSIDHIGFLYEDLEEPFEALRARGYSFPLEPVRMRYFDEESLYSFAIVMSPDSLQTELTTEDGRQSARPKALED